MRASLAVVCCLVSSAGPQCMMAERPTLGGWPSWPKMPKLFGKKDSNFFDVTVTTTAEETTEAPTTSTTTTTTDAVVREVAALRMKERVEKWKKREKALRKEFKGRLRAYRSPAGEVRWDKLRSVLQSRYNELSQLYRDFAVGLDQKEWNRVKSFGDTESYEPSKGMDEMYWPRFKEDLPHWDKSDGIRPDKRAGVDPHLVAPSTSQRNELFRVNSHVGMGDDPESQAARVKLREKLKENKENNAAAAPAAAAAPSSATRT